MLASSVVIHRVGVARKRRDRARLGFHNKATHDKENIDRAIKTLHSKEELIMPERALEAVYELRNQPKVEGLLMKRGKSWMGFGETKWRKKFVILDPQTGNLAYWDAQNTSSTPKRTYPLEDLIYVEVNDYHNTIMLNFCGPSSRKQVNKGLTFMAQSKEDFDHWVELVSRYGMKGSLRESATGVIAARAA